MRRFLFLFLFLLSIGAQAGLFKITCTGTCSTAITTVANQLADDINNDLPDADASTYLEGMANSSVMSGKHIGMDYANDVDAFLVAIGIGTGFDVGDKSFGDVISGDIEANQVRGVGLQPSALFGLNLGMFDFGSIGPIDLDRLRVFANIGVLNIEASGVNLETKNFGMHFRYKFYEPEMFVPGRMLYWTGLDISTGIEWNKLNINTTQSRTAKEFTQGGITASMTGTVAIEADVNTYSIPVEVSSGFQLGYLFSVYGGLGADISFGKAEATASVNAPITVTGSSDTLTGSLELGQDNSPTALGARAFVGFQFNASLLRLVNVQIDRMLTGDAWAIGIRPLSITW